MKKKRILTVLIVMVAAISLGFLTGDQVLQNAWNSGASRFEVYVTGSAAPATVTEVRDWAQVSGALDRTTAVAAKWRPQEITLHASGAVVEACTVKKVSKSTGNPETIIAIISAGWTDAYVTISSPLYGSGDEIRVECANSGAATIDVDVSGEGA